MSCNITIFTDIFICIVFTYTTSITFLTKSFYFTVFTNRTTTAILTLTSHSIMFTDSSASAFFAISPRPPSLKVGRQEVADSLAATALAAIEDEDPDWYCLLMTNHTAADQLAGNDFVKTRSKIFLAESQLAALKSAGATASITGITRTGTVATAIAAAPHSLSNGDLVTISGASQSGYNGTFIVSNITSTDFDFTVAAATVTPATGTLLWAPGQVDELWNTSGEVRSAMLWHQLADSVFPASAWAARQLEKDPGSSTWAFKSLTGIAGSTLTNITAAEEAYLLAKGTNVYAFVGNTGTSQTWKGRMPLTNRFIDQTRSEDLLNARIAENILIRLQQEPKVPYTDAGAAILQREVTKVFDDNFETDMLTALLFEEDGVTPRTDGKKYTEDVPKVATQSTANRAARNFPGMSFDVQFAGAIHSTEVDVNVSV